VQTSQALDASPLRVVWFRWTLTGLGKVALAAQDEVLDVLGQVLLQRHRRERTDNT
jgi:hypothetical protein